MSDSLDKFVLQYTVELKDSIARLEKLQDKVKKTSKESDKLTDSFKDVAKNIPGVDKGIALFDKLGGSIKKIPPQAFVAAAAILAIAAAVKLVTANMKEYEAQRATGQKSGMSVNQVEDFQRQMSKGSRGRVNAESARGAMETISGKLRSAQTDPNQNNRDAIGLRMAGVNIRSQGGGFNSSTNAMQQMMEKFKATSEENAIALGAVVGLTQDQSVALRQYAVEAGTASSMTVGEAKAKEASAKTMERLSQAGGRMDEALRVARSTLADALIPKLDWLADVITWVANGIEKGAKGIVNGGAMVIDFFANFWKRVKEAFSGSASAKDFAENLSTVLGDTVTDTIKDRDERRATVDKEYQSKMNESAEKIWNAETNALRAANLFSNAVMAFSNAVDEREAWAAWAGMIGTASGLRDDGKDTGSAPKHPRYGGSPVAGATDGGKVQLPGNSAFPLASVQAGSTPSSGGKGAANRDAFDDLIAASSKKHGVPADLIKKVIRVESNFNPNANSHQGAQGLMQILPSIAKAYSVKNAFDPAQNIDAGTRLLAENLKRTNGNQTEALLQYHGGLNKKNWGPLTNAYPGKVLGANIGQVKATPQQVESDAGTAPPVASQGRFAGPTKSSMFRDDLIRNIESALGVPFAQIKQGGVSKGDVSKVLNNMYNGQLNHINELKTKLQGIGMPQTEVMKMQRELVAAERNLAGLKSRGSEVLAGMAEGGQNVTFGANSVIISVDGAKEPFQTAKAVKNELYTNTNASVDQQSRSSGLKY